MTAQQIWEFLKSFKWHILRNMYGSAHCSIIGFISSSWISQSHQNTVLDGAPSPRERQSKMRDHKRRGQKNADIILCKQKKPYVVVEVESYNYLDKIKTIQKYIKDKELFGDLKFGLLVMTNVYDDSQEDEKCWEEIKDEIRKMKSDVAVVFLEKNKEILDVSAQDQLRKLNHYSSKTIGKIKCWVHTSKGDIRKIL